MLDTATLSICGNVVADPRVTGLGDSPERVSFRVISNRRRRNPQTGEWINYGEYGMNVVCWRKLARGVAQSVHKGDPVLVIGRISERQYTGGDGQLHWSTEVTADFVGPDLSQGVSGRFARFTQLDRLADRTATGADAATSTDSGPVDDADDADDAEDADDTADGGDAGGFGSPGDRAGAERADASEFDLGDADVREPEPAVF